VVVLGEEVLGVHIGAGWGSSAPVASRKGGPHGKGCPSACDNGRAIDNSVCPQLSSDGIEAILQTLDANSVVWEWGEGASAIYFGQCVKEWNVMISDPDHCRDIQDMKPPNVKVHCMGAVHGATADAYASAIRAAGSFDVVVVDGSFKGECLRAAAGHLNKGGKVFVREWEAPLRAQAKQSFELEDVVGQDKLATLLLKEGSGGSQQLAAVRAPSSRGAVERQAAGGGGQARAGPPGGGARDQVDGTQIGKAGDKLTQYVSGEWEAGTEGDDKVHRGGGGDGRGNQKPEMVAWQGDERVRRWKADVRKRVLTDPIPDKWGPKEAYPCPNACPKSGLHLDNTACPMMWPKEAALLLGALTAESVVFEWGSGTSSLYYSQCVTNWTSIEHHTPWCHEMQKLAPPNVRVMCVPIEKEYEVSFGSPGTWDGSKTEFKTYVEAAKEVGRFANSADVVIIDGRARGDCSLEVLPYLRPDSLVFIHDWQQSRFGGTEQYDKALAAYDIVDVVNIRPPASWRSPSGLVMLRPKPDALANAKKALGRG
jgi:hypothetical protein